MDSADWILWILLSVSILALLTHLLRSSSVTEPFLTQGGDVSMAIQQSVSTAALDSAPTTPEAKDYYKKLLVFCDNDIRHEGLVCMRILADFRDRVYGPHNFRDNLVVDDYIGNWPDWLPPLPTTSTETPPTKDDAITAELRLLAYLQKYYPQEPTLNEDTSSTIRNMIEDFGYRFVFKKGEETVKLRDDFLKEPLLKNWRQPV